MYYIRQEYKPTRISGSPAVVVFSGRGLLHSIHINASSGRVDIYDALSVTGTPIAVIASGTLVSGEILDYVCGTGLTISSPATSTDITVATANN
jgi:hypothetical protein